MKWDAEIVFTNMIMGEWNNNVVLDICFAKLIWCIDESTGVLKRAESE